MFFLMWQSLLMWIKPSLLATASTKSRLFPSSVWQLALWRWLPHTFSSAFSCISHFFQCFLPLGLSSFTPHFPGVQCPAQLEQKDWFMSHKPHFLILCLGVALAIFTTVWHCWLTLGLSLTVTPTPISAELLPNLLLHIQDLHCLLSGGYCSCVYWASFPPTLLFCWFENIILCSIP